MEPTRVFGLEVAAQNNEAREKEAGSPRSSEASDTVVYSAMRLDTNVSINSAFLPVGLKLSASATAESLPQSVFSSCSQVTELGPQRDEALFATESTTLESNPSQATLGLEIANLMRDKSSESGHSASPKHLKKRASSSAIKAREILPLLPVLPPKPPCLPIKSFDMPLHEMPPTKRVWEKPDFYRRRVRAPLVPLVNYHAEKRRLGGLDPLSYPYNAFPRIPQDSGIETPSAIAKAVEDNVQVWSINTNTVHSATEMKKLLRKLDTKTNGQTFSSARRCAICHYAPRRPLGETSSSSHSPISLHAMPLSSSHKSLKTTSLPLMLPITPSTNLRDVLTSVDTLPVLKVSTKELVGQKSSVSVVSQSVRSDSTLKLSESTLKSYSSTFTQTESIGASPSPSQLDGSQFSPASPTVGDSRPVVQETSELIIRNSASPEVIKTQSKSSTIFDDRLNSPKYEGDRTETPRSND